MYKGLLLSPEEGSKRLLRNCLTTTLDTLMSEDDKLSFV